MTGQDVDSNPSLDRVRLRPDIQWYEYAGGAQARWVARDPISLEYFYFSELERSTALLLDGSRSWKQLLSDGDAFGVSNRWLAGLLAKLEGACLTVPHRSSRGQQLWAIQQRQSQQGVIQAFLSPLAVRLKLFDPTRLLAALDPIARLLFSRALAAALVVTTVIVFLLVAARFMHAPQEHFAHFTRFGTANVVPLLITLLIVKSLHELGHALACRKWKAECHEIGILFLAFTPCLYCNTSDSWKLANRFHRASIAAAGIYVELVIAALAGIVWLVTPTETSLHQLATNTMLICSVSTVVVNANPLLRYDGYYVLSDLWGVPNLTEQSQEALSSVIMRWFTGRGAHQSRWDASMSRLSCFAAAAWIYRHFVLAMILYVVWILLKQYGLQILAVATVVVSLGTTLLVWLRGFRRLFGDVVGAGTLKPFRTLFSMILIAALFWGVFAVPLPTYVRCRAIASMKGSEPIYAQHDGTLKQVASEGQHVAAGDIIASLDSPELELELIGLRGDVQLLQTRAKQLQIISIQDSAASTELENVRQELAKAKEKLRLKEEDRSALTLTAKTSGTLIAGERTPIISLTDLPDRHRKWSYLSSRHIGSFVSRGTRLAWLATSDRAEVTAYVLDKDAKLLTPQMKAVCRWDNQANSKYAGRISKISSEPIAELAAALTADASIEFETSPSGRHVPVHPVYAISVATDGQPDSSCDGAMLTVHFQTQSRTVFQSFMRWIDQNIRPDL